MTKEQRLQGFAWGLSAAVVAIAIVAWGETYNWKFNRLGIYQIFPLLGLTAFSLMWTHYIMGAIRRYVGVDKSALKIYFEVTAAIVLAAILMHPGLLTFQLWRDGLGLPPGSDLKYVEPAARWAILLGFTSLALFLLFELRRVYDNRPWWKYVEYASDGAMVLIYFHALKLGGALQLDWYRAIWYIYGVALLGAFIYIQVKKHEKSLQK